MGSQWLSCPYQQRVREIIRSGKLGKIVSISQSWNFNGPRWHVPKSEDVASLREKDTDWKRWLLGRPDRPFDPRLSGTSNFQRFFGWDNGSVVQPRVGAGAFLPGYVHSGSRCRTAGFLRGTMSARIRIRSSACRRSAASRFCTRTRLRSAVATGTTPSFAARMERCIRRAGKGVRSGGLSRRIRARGGRMWCSICTRGKPSRSR